MKKIIALSMLMLSVIVVTAPRVMAADDLTPKKTAAVLNRLIELNIDGEKGFREAADHVASADLKAHFIEKSAEHAGFAAELKAKVQQLGQEAEQTGSAMGVARRAWIDVKTAVTQNDDKAVLEVVKSQQAKSVAEYRRALRKNTLDIARDVVAAQDEKIQDCYDWIQDQLSDEKIDEEKWENDRKALDDKKNV